MSKRTNKKKSMERTNKGVSSAVSNRPHKNVSINITVEGDSQGLDNTLSQKQDIKYQQPIQKPQVVQEKPDEGLKEQLALAIKKLDLANDMATKAGINLPNRLQIIPQNVLDVKTSQDIRTLISYITNMISEIVKMTQKPTTSTPLITPTLRPQTGPSIFTAPITPAPLIPQTGTSVFTAPITPAPLIPQTGTSVFIPPTTTVPTTTIPPLIPSQGQTESQDPNQATIENLNAYEKSLAEYFSTPSTQTLENLSTAVKPLNNDPNFDAIFTTQNFFQSKGVGALTNFLTVRGVGASEAQQMSKTDKITNILNTLKEKGILVESQGGGRRLLSITPITPAEQSKRRTLGIPDYERQGDQLRDITVQNAQLALQRGDLPVLEKSLIEVIQAESILSQYIVLEPRNDYDALIKAQIMDLDKYKNTLETAIRTKSQATPTQPITPTPTPKNLEADFEAFKGRYNKEITGNKDTVLMLRSVLFDIIQRARAEQNDTILNQAVNYDENIVDRLMILEKKAQTQPTQPAQPTQPPVQANEFAPYLTNEKKKLQDYLMSKPQTNRPRAVQADSVITNRINQKISLLDLAINKPNLTDDEFDVAMALIPIDIIKSWPASRALVILKGESVKPNRLSKVELKPVQTPAGVPQLYKLYFDNTELTGADNTETYFKSTGELYESKDLTPPQTSPPQTPQTSLIQQKLDMLYTTGNPNTNTVASVLKTQIETGGDTIIDRAGNNLPTAYAAIVSGFNDQRIIKNIVLQPADMISFGGNSDQAYILIVDGVQFKPMGMTRYFNRFGEDYTGIDYEGGYNPTLTYPFRKN
jgi:hypothetical protein